MRVSKHPSKSYGVSESAIKFYFSTENRKITFLYNPNYLQAWIQ